MANQQPSFQAYTVVKREGQDDFWLNIGAAFMHQDGDGYNIMLQALPLNGKIVLRPPKAQSDEPAQPPARENPRRHNNRDRRKNKEQLLDLSGGAAMPTPEPHPRHTICARGFSYRLRILSD